MRALNIPGPRSRWLSTYRLYAAPYRAYAEWEKTYGKTFLLPSMNGDVVVTGCPVEARTIFALRSNEVGPFGTDVLRPMVGSGSLFLLEGEKHRAERKLLMPSFHGDRMRSYARLIHDVAARKARSWTPGDTVVMMEVAREISVEVIVRVVFGVESEERLAVYQGAIRRLVQAFHPALMFSRAFQVRCFGFTWWDRFLRERTRFDALIYEDIRERRAKGTRGDDILSVFMDAKYENGEQLDDNALRDELVTLLLAGHETTQIAISWVMSWLHRSDDARERLLTDGSLDMGEPDSWARSPWLGAVVNESLRLNPILPDVVRTLKVPFELSGVAIPAGYHVAVATSLLHTNPEVYERPHEFVPQRFIDHTFRPHEYTPFGGGLRRCIAASLATYEIHIVVATWMREHRFERIMDAPEKEPVHRRNVTMAPTSGIPLTYLGRR